MPILSIVFAVCLYGVKKTRVFEGFMAGGKEDI